MKYKLWHNKLNKFVHNLHSPDWSDKNIWEYAITPDWIVRFYESCDWWMDYFDDPNIKIIYEN